jgi:hypothetical protein
LRLTVDDIDMDMLHLHTCIWDLTVSQRFELSNEAFGIQLWLSLLHENS